MTGDLTDLFNEPEEDEELNTLYWEDIYNSDMSYELINTLKKASALISLKKALKDIKDK